MKKINKKRLIFIIIISTLLLIFLFALIKYAYNKYRIAHATVKIVLIDDLTVDVYKEVDTNYFIRSINGKVLNNKKIDTSTLGEKVIEFTYLNDENIKIPYKYKIEVKDKTTPLITKYKKVYAEVGEEDFYKDIFCGDNYDNKPKCYVEGEYDINNEGTYNITFIGKDSSNNISSNNMELIVREKSSSKSTTTSKPNLSNGTNYVDIITNYKKDNIKIGIDVSKWQKEIDFEKVKENGVKFVFIRVGYQTEINGEYILDKYFKKNIEGFNKVNIPVGVYFYSKANSKEEAIKQAKWVHKQIKKYDVDLPVVFDWENWSSYQEYNLSFHSLTEISNTFLNTIEKYGYKSMLYGSKNYLQTVLYENKKDVWLAHYIDQTNYQGDYKVWQICENGYIDGINTYVDIDIMYE